MTGSSLLVCHRLFRADSQEEAEEEAFDCPSGSSVSAAEEEGDMTCCLARSALAVGRASNAGVGYPCSKRSNTKLSFNAISDV